MTSAESTLLGIVIGAALAWLGGMLNSRLQWQRERRRRQADRRAELYQDMLAEADRLMRAQQRAHAVGPENAPGAEFPEEEAADRLARYGAKVILFGSGEVHMLWIAWFDALVKNAIPVEDSDYPARKHRLEAALQALTDQMRDEVDPS